MTDTVSPSSAPCNLHGIRPFSREPCKAHDMRNAHRCDEPAGTPQDVPSGTPPPHHSCSCGVVFTRAGWESLSLVGYTPIDAWDPDGPLLELRDCSHCGSTRAVQVRSLRDLVRVVNAELRTCRRERADWQQHHEEHQAKVWKVWAFFCKLVGDSLKGPSPFVTLRRADLRRLSRLIRGIE